MFFNSTLAAISVLLFLYGFFPMPQYNLNRSTTMKTLALPYNKSTEPHFHKTVLIVIDGLRLDFVTEQLMPFTYVAMQFKGCLSALHVEPPTVTLPRIKALTTGHIPQFADLVLNLAGSPELSDSLLHEYRRTNRKIVFYGDDVWLQLFPRIFERSEGVSAFYVSDFTEVDNNVTRNLNAELRRNDWDMMILHYLGLDHIGHIYGPRSPLIIKKLKEMDEIVKKVSNTFIDGLILVTGDHGMRDFGGHGGTTYPETHVPLIMLGTNCTNDEISQIDVSANLASLLHFPIPITSIGQIHRSFLQALNYQQFLQILKQNTLDLIQKIGGECDEIHNATILHVEYLQTKNVKTARKAEELYTDCARQISGKLVRTSTGQNFNHMLLALLIILNIILKIVNNYGKCNDTVVDFLEFLSLCFITVINLFFPSILHCCLTFGFVLRNIVLLLKKIPFELNIVKNCSKFLLIGTILHPLVFSSSSFIEEEQQFWYFIPSSVILVMNLAQFSKYLIVVLGLIRFVIDLNQTGDQWAHLSDFSDWLLENSHFHLMLFVASLILVYFCVYQSGIVPNFSIICSLLCIFIFRWYFNGFNVLLGRFIWFTLFVNSTFLPFQSTWILIMCLLFKSTNVILIPVGVYCAKWLLNSFKNNDLVIMQLWLGNLLFFAQGHSNSLASVDVSSGYIGLSTYQPILVTLQVLCHTYAFPILCAIIVLGAYFRENSGTDKSHVFNMILLQRMFAFFYMALMAILQRHHLFIWSVFAPKLCIEAVHSLVYICLTLIYNCIASLIHKSPKDMHKFT